jgi:5-formyltetrahydrofolate cyclo-ligase
MNPAESKEELRHRMQQELRALDAEDRRGRSLQICNHVLELPVWKQAHVVMVFEPFKYEPEITPLISDLQRRGSEIIAILPTARSQHDVAIFGPIDLVLVPGIAFTRSGARMGRGFGFFDRFLAHRALAAIKVGVAFRFQILESLPLESHDIKLDLVVTD